MPLWKVDFVRLFFFIVICGKRNGKKKSSKEEHDFEINLAGGLNILDEWFLYIT